MKMKTQPKREIIIEKVERIISKVSKENFKRCLILLESGQVASFWWIPNIKEGDKVKLIGVYWDGCFEVDDYYVFNPQKKINDYFYSCKIIFSNR